MSGKAISEYMTETPHTIGVDQPAKVAQEYMREHSIRHIPVLKGGRVVGIVSNRDLQFLFAFSDIDPENVPVEEAMSPEVYCASPDTSMKEVTTEMAEQKIGSAVVMKGNEVVGIFTTTDALQALSAFV